MGLYLGFVWERKPRKIPILKTNCTDRTPNEERMKGILFTFDQAWVQKVNFFHVVVGSLII